MKKTWMILLTLSLWGCFRVVHTLPPPPPPRPPNAPELSAGDATQIATRYASSRGMRVDKVQKTDRDDECWEVKLKLDEPKGKMGVHVHAMTGQIMHVEEKIKHRGHKKHKGRGEGHDKHDDDDDDD
jgi:hypothetical protein